MINNNYPNLRVSNIRDIKEKQFHIQLILESMEEEMTDLKNQYEEINDKLDDFMDEAKEFMRQEIGYKEYR